MLPRDSLWSLVNIRRGVRLQYDVRGLSSALRASHLWLPVDTIGTLLWFGNVWAHVRLRDGSLVSVPRDAIAPNRPRREETPS